MRMIEHPTPYPVSDLISGAVDDGRYIYVSGTVGFVAEQAETEVQAPADEGLPGRLAGGIEEQTRAALTHISRTLDEAGLSMRDIVKVNAYLADLGQHSAGYNRVFKEFFRAHKPARTTIGAQLVGQMLVEIDCVAVRTGNGGPHGG